jgi:hypothetical protein
MNVKASLSKVTFRRADSRSTPKSPKAGLLAGLNVGQWVAWPLIGVAHSNGLLENTRVTPILSCKGRV